MANIFDNLKQMAQLKQQADQFQRLLAGKIVEVSSPGKELRLKVNGKMELLAVEISADCLKPERKDFVEKLFVRTWAQAQREVQKVIGSELKSQMGNLPI